MQSNPQSLSKLKNIFVSFLLLSITLSSLFLIIIAPIEMKAVHDSNQWEKIPARMISAQYELPAFHRGVIAVSYTHLLFKSNQSIQSELRFLALPTMLVRRQPI